MDGAKRTTAARPTVESVLAAKKALPSDSEVAKIKQLDLKKSQTPIVLKQSLGCCEFVYDVSLMC